MWMSLAFSKQKTNFRSMYSTNYLFAYNTNNKKTLRFHLFMINTDVPSHVDQKTVPTEVAVEISKTSDLNGLAGF